MVRRRSLDGPAPHVKSVTRKCAPNGELPSDPQAPASPKLCKKPVSQFIIAPRAQASRRCETQAPLGEAAKLCYRFGPLTPSARSANLIAGDGTKNGLSRSEQKTVCTTQNNRLTGKAPYRFESAFPPAASLVRTRFFTNLWRSSRAPMRRHGAARREYV